MAATKPRYVHIGYPKAASTTVQNSFFSSHPNLYHVGNGYKGANNTYADDGVEWVAETVIRYRKEYMYNAEETREAFVDHFEAAEKDPNIKLMGFSSEFFAFTIGQEVDSAIKAKRLHDIFGDNTKIIFIFREQFSLLRSLYLEMVRGGYYKTFRKFMDYTYLFQDRNWCHDFCYDKVYETYAKLFGEKNMVPIPFELLKESEPAFMKMITDGLGVPPMEKQLPKMNAGKEDKGFYEHLRRMNDKAHHQFGNGFFEPFQAMRMRTFFHNELGIAIPRDAVADEAIQMPLGQTAKKLQDASPLPDIDMTMSKGVEERLGELYAKSNERFQKLSGIDIKKYNYRFPE